MILRLDSKKMINKILIKFFEWLYFQKQFYDDNGNYYQNKIVRIKGINCFLIDKYYGKSKTPSERHTVSPIWDKKRVLNLFRRFFKGVRIKF